MRRLYIRPAPNECRLCNLPTEEGISPETGLCYSEERRCGWKFMEWMVTAYPALVQRHRQTNGFTWIRQEFGPYVDQWLETL